MAGEVPPIVLTYMAVLAPGFEETGTKAAASAEGVGKKAEAASSGGIASLTKAGKFAALGLAGIGVAAVKMAGDFQSSMTGLVTGAGESEDNLKTVSSGILSMAGQVGESTTQLAQGMFMIESAGYHGADGLNVLKASAEGAKIGGADLQSVADGLTTALVDYKIPASDAAKVTSQLVETVASGKTHMADLSGALATVLPAASAAHVGLTEVLGAMATMTAGGTPAADAATYLKQTIAQLSNPTAKAKGEMEALGLSSIDVSANLGTRGLTGTMKVLTDAITAHMGPAGLVLIDTLKKSAGSATGFQSTLNALPPTQQTYIAALADMVGGTKSMQAALELTGSNADTFTTNVKNISAATTDAKGNVQGWALTQKDFNQKLDQAKAQAQVLGIELGTKLIPVVEHVIAAVQHATTWLNQHKDAAKALAVVLGSVLAVAIGAYLVVSIGKFVSMLGEAAKALTLTGKAARLFGAEAAEGEAAAELPLLPWIAAVALVGIAAYELYKHWDQVWSFIKRITEDAWHFIKQNLDYIGLGLIVLGGPIFALIGIGMILYNHWQMIWGGISTAFRVAIDFIVDHAKLILAIMFPLIGLAIDAIWTHWSSIWGAIQAVFGAVVDAIMAIVNNFLLPQIHAIVDTIQWLWGIWSDIWGWISSAVGTAWAVISPILGVIKTAGLDILHTAISDFSDTWNTLWDGISGAVSWVWSVIQPILETMKSAISDVVNPVKDVMGAAGSAGGAVKHFFGFADGGVVPGAPGAPQLILAHGGEVVLNQAQQAGISPVPVGPGGTGYQAGAGIVSHTTVTNLVLDGQTIATSTQTHLLRMKSTGQMPVVGLS